MTAPADYEPILWAEAEDPEMRRAIAQAQATFPAFLSQVFASGPQASTDFDHAIVKIFFSHPENPLKGEHMWVTDLELHGAALHGTLTGEPGFVPGLVEGQDVAIDPACVSDWILVSGEHAVGGFTVQVIKQRIPPEQWPEYSSQAPFVWFEHQPPKRDPAA